MTKDDIYNLLKAHATELIEGSFRFKRVDLKAACAELEDCFKRLHKHSVVRPASASAVGGEPLQGEAVAKSVSDGDKNKFEVECWPRCEDYPICFCGA